MNEAKLNQEMLKEIIKLVEIKGGDNSKIHTDITM